VTFTEAATAELRERIHGLLTAAMERSARGDEQPDPAEIEYYLCGPPMMIAAVQRMLDNLGVEPEMIAYDNFG